MFNNKMRVDTPPPQFPVLLHLERLSAADLKLLSKIRGLCGSVPVDSTQSPELSSTSSTNRDELYESLKTEDEAFCREFLKFLESKIISQSEKPVIEVNYKDVNVLENEELREGIKKFSNWPTIPQLYVKGEFVGGCDIITEMAMSGELDDLLVKNNINFNTESATKIRDANKD